jgi:hypothetical protein
VTAFGLVLKNVRSLRQNVPFAPLDRPTTGMVSEPPVCAGRA